MKKPKWLEKMRVGIIRKLGGFTIDPPDQKHIIIQSTTVKPEQIMASVIFDAYDMYDVTPGDLMNVAKGKLHDKLVSGLEKRGYIDTVTAQDPDTGGLRIKASIWVVNPDAMREAMK